MNHEPAGHGGFLKKMSEALLLLAEPFLVCAPWAHSNGCKSRTRPDSGKCIAEQQISEI